MGSKKNKQNRHVCDGKFQNRKRRRRKESENVTQSIAIDTNIVDAGERRTVGIDENSVVMANQENSVGVVDGENTEMIEEENTEMVEEENTEMIEENTEMIEEENTEMVEEENTEMIEEENTEMVEEENTEMVDGEPANDTVRVEIDGARIVNMSRLEQYINELTSHAAKCEKSAGSVVLVGERKDGLASIISTECSGCGHVVKLETSPKVAGPSGYNRWEINLAAVWGQMCTGGGNATLQESLGYVGVSVMTKKSFISTIGEWWRERLQQSMIQAGIAEREMAIDRGDYHEGVPAITVVVDGGWSKRSHRHSYNAKSGVGIIVGLETSKILHLSVRNKYCSSCARGSPPDQRHCYRNWTDSSSEMEKSTILEGFKNAEKIHGVRYMQRLTTI